ncbi:hypothetical protein GCM10027419_38400 [Pandoraea terrae]
MIFDDGRAPLDALPPILAAAQANFNLHLHYAGYMDGVAQAVKASGWRAGVQQPYFAACSNAFRNSGEASVIAQ